MKDTVYFQLFGTPQIFLNGQPILFSFSKINALLYYLVVNKTASRDEVAGLLWVNKSEKSAKKNLRNTIYQANKVLGDDYIVSPNKTILTLNESLEIESDINSFLSNPVAHFDLYQDDFLKGFFLKDSEAFDLWVVKMQNFYEQRFVQTCYQKIEQDLHNNELTHVEENIRRLIAIDEFDERNYQLLMQYYQDNQRFGKVIETYYELSSLLEQELGILPNSETKAIYEKTLAIVNHKKQHKIRKASTLFFGRTAEIEQLETNFNLFSQDQPYHSALIVGDAGVGKSALSKRVLTNVQEDFHILEVSCYQAEKDHLLRPWRGLIEQITQIIEEECLVDCTLWQETVAKFFPSLTNAPQEADYIETEIKSNINYLSQVILEVLQKISKTKKMIIFIEDIQWMDVQSIGLLTSLMLHVKHGEALFLLTLRTGYQTDIENFMATVINYEKLLTIRLAPFSKQETIAFVQKQLGNLPIDTMTMNHLFDYTEGNPFFLVEYIGLLKMNMNLDVMTVKMQDAIKNRFSYLSPVEKEVVDIVSYFYDMAPISLIAQLLGKDQLVIINAIDRLVNKNILEEKLYEEESHASFTHVKLREFIYLNQSVAKKRILHGKIAVILEEQVPLESSDPLLLSKIAYHYRKAKQELKSLEYELAYLQNFFKFQHELFPVYNRQEIRGNRTIDVEQEYTFERFRNIRQQLADLEAHHEQTEKYQLLLVKFLYLEGRYLIHCGDYNQGIENIQRVIFKSKSFHNEEYLLEGYRQMIYYYIQTDNAVDMFHYIELAMNASIKANNHESIGILLRLKGLYYLMSGDKEQAERLFYESITTFTITEAIKKKYAVNIAAAYDYLAEIERLRGNVNQSVAIQEKALALCEGTGVYSSLVVFYVDMGIALFAQKNYMRAREYFEKAQNLYTKLPSLWKKIQLNAYTALIDLQEENYEAVHKFLINSKEYLDTFSNPRDAGIVYFVKALVKHQLVHQQIADKPLAVLLAHSESYYYEKATASLSVYRDRYELQVLEELFTKLLPSTSVNESV
ncbi:AAA family ATPase [Enterococcus sp. CWB-B31]|uniref:AAA family ATPase n=1 Tax=Enterococcus sp. CWB-B31 TaxID=2885159 RepID=UPI001E5B3301|nr:AAA family ATPase [Enterococcus sp. CWB-B31]MCB5955349.1 AAA family ATPase [Enterococcus sp. CWB-B31]